MPHVSSFSPVHARRSRGLRPCRGDVVAGRPGLPQVRRDRRGIRVEGCSEQAVEEAPGRQGAPRPEEVQGVRQAVHRADRHDLRGKPYRPAPVATGHLPDDRQRGVYQRQSASSDARHHAQERVAHGPSYPRGNARRRHGEFRFRRRRSGGRRDFHRPGQERDRPRQTT